jgi:tRNA pseudouridine38-40 synthase
MSMRLLVHDDQYTPEVDPEGLAHADLINAHLPADIRVFTVQKTNKKFNARHLALSRIYEYYLPVSMLGEALVSLDTQNTI